MDELNEGDVVRLNSGGPKMTVKYVIGKSKLPPNKGVQVKLNGLEDGDVICNWFDNSLLKENDLKKINVKNEI